jgi:hypothetical protein
MKQWISNNKLYLIGAALGAVAGFLYWKYVGCLSGSCAITSSPRNSTIYFAVMGALLLGMFRKQQQEKPRQTTDDGQE